MRAASLRIVLSLVVATSAYSADLYFPSIPEDPYAFPKYRVSFLNGFSLSNTTAQQWLAHGLKGGEPEFLGKEPTSADRASTPSPRSIEPGQQQVAHEPISSHGGHDVALSAASNIPAHSLQLMHIGSKSSYMCLIPPPPPPPSFASNEDRATAAATRSPATSWELLQPMSQGCLYYTLGWFTYAYCHNKYVKQFREAAHAHPHPPGGRTPQEDPEWESYYLGIAPSPETTGSDIVSPEQLAAANKLELARGAGQRYLVQRWEDGTACDKTNQPRKIEVQFHCSMTTPDKILLIKETSVCSYVLVIHTPRLCGEPGFKSERASQEESVLRCREIVSDDLYASEQASIAAAKQTTTKIDHGPGGAGGGESKPIAYVEAPHPFRFAPGQRPRAVTAPAAAPAANKPQAKKPAAAGQPAGGKGTAASGKKRDSADIIRDAIKALLSGGEGAGGAGQAGGDDVEVVIEDVDMSDYDDTVVAAPGTTGDVASGSKEGGKKARQPAAKEVAELFGRDADDIVAVQGEDGSTSYFIVDNMEEVDDLDHFAALLDNAANNGGDGGGGEKRLDAIRKRLLSSLTKSEPADDEDSHHRGDSSSTADDNVPESHDEL